MGGLQLALIAVRVQLCGITVQRRRGEKVPGGRNVELTDALLGDVVPFSWGEWWRD